MTGVQTCALPINLISSEEQIISTKEIGDQVLTKLTRIDKLAGLLFAAVYKDFSCLEDIHKELKRLEQVQNKKKKNV